MDHPTIYKNFSHKAPNEFTHCLVLSLASMRKVNVYLTNQNGFTQKIRDSLTYYCVVLGVKVVAASFIMALLFSALAVAVLFGTVHAFPSFSGTSKPSVPEFTVALVDASYDVPTT